MALTPSQILAVNSGGAAGDSSISGLLAANRSKQDRLATELAKEGSGEEDKSFWDKAKGAVGSVFGDVVQPIGSALDYGRAALVAGAAEAGDVLRQAAGKETFGTKGGASWEDVKRNINRRVGVGDLLQENTATQNLPMNVKRAIAFAGDTAADPLNLVGTGTNVAAKAAIGKVSREAGEDVARILVTQGEKAADEAIAAAAAKAAAEKIGPAPLTATERFQNAAKALRNKEAGITTLEPAAKVAEVAPPKTVRSILADAGVTGDAAEKALKNVERTGQGGLRVAGRTVAGTEDLAKIPGWQAAGDIKRAAGESVRLSGPGKAVREALVPMARVRDKFDDEIAKALPAIYHARSHQIAKTTNELDKALAEAGARNVKPEEATRMFAALDVGGDTATAINLLNDEGLTDAANTLGVLAEARDRAYQTLREAGVPAEDLMDPQEYIRHALSPEGLEHFGIDPAAMRHAPGTPSGSFKQRVREGAAVDQNTELGFDAYKTDPIAAVRGSFEHAQAVGGNKLAFDLLDDLAAKVGRSDITRTSAKEGFTKIAPDAYIADDIYDSIINVRKAGANNSIVKGWDALTGILKRYTLFGPIAFGPYFMQNMATGVTMNAARGVGPAHYALNLKIMKAIKEAEQAGVKGFTVKGADHFDEALRAALPDPEEYRRAKAAWDNGLVDPGNGTYDDLATSAKGKYNITAPTVKVNAFGEEMLRGSLFQKAMDDGLTASEAADLVHKTHLDYSAVGKTAFERNAINRFIFFPTWLLRAPRAIISTYAGKPGLAMAQMRLEQGTQWYDRERNEYGDVLGQRLSGPMSFLTGLGQGQAPGSVGEILNPMAKAIIDPSSVREVSDIITPLSQVKRASDVIEDPTDRARYAMSLGGVRTGVDYSGESAVEDLQKRIAEREALGGEATPSQTLAMRAIPILGPQAAGMSTRDLVIGLTDAGVKAADVRRILEAPYKSIERQPLNPKVSGSDLDQMLESGMNPDDIRDLLVNG